jgi:hypothetical protein
MPFRARPPGSGPLVTVMNAARASGEGCRGVNPVHGMCPARKGVMRVRSWWPALRQ